MSYKEQIKKMIDGVKITSIKTYEVEGKAKFVKNQAPFANYSGGFKDFGENKVSDKTTARKNLLNHIIGALYSYYYCGIPQDADQTQKASKAEEAIFIDKLSEANKSKGGVDKNWLIYSVDQSGHTFARKGEELRWLQPEGFEYQNPMQQYPQVNTYVNIKKQREGRTIQPTFYHVFSDEIFPQEVELARFYWNIKPSGAAALIEAITTVLNDYKIPFQFKCSNHPSLYIRTDPAVLYLDKKHVQIVSILLKSIIKEVDEHLKVEVPMFTKKIYSGVGYAEDPGKSMSFGMSRCTVIGEALVDSFLLKEEITLDKVLNSLKNKGFEIERMHLNKHTELIPNFPHYD